jgi:hypothetical protein
MKTRAVNRSDLILRGEQPSRVPKLMRRRSSRARCRKEELLAGVCEKEMVVTVPSARKSNNSTVWVCLAANGKHVTSSSRTHSFLPYSRPHTKIPPRLAKGREISILPLDLESPPFELSNEQPGDFFENKLPSMSLVSGEKTNFQFVSHHPRCPRFPLVCAFESTSIGGTGDWWRRHHQFCVFKGSEY